MDDDHPHASSSISSEERVALLLPALGIPEEPRSTEVRREHSNEVAEIGFSDGRTLIVKRALYDWAAARFRASRVASGLMRQVGILTPAPLDLRDDLDERPLEVYWRIDLPTLQELWPGLSERARWGALRSWGKLVRHLHRIRLRGYGPLPAAQREKTPLEEFLREDLGARLLPAVCYAWPEGQALVQRLLGAVPEVSARAGAKPPSLVHNALHAGHVLCEVADEEMRCVGLLDLESVLAAPPEADLARTEVLHGPLFQQPLSDTYLERLREGYGEPLDPVVLSFFRIYHLANLGYHSAEMGYGHHAQEIADQAGSELEQLEVEVLA